MRAVVLLLCVTLTTAARAADADLAKARKLLLGGKYAEAAETISLRWPTNRPRPRWDWPAAARPKARRTRPSDCSARWPRNRPSSRRNWPGWPSHRGDLKEAEARADAALRLAPEQLLARCSGRAGPHGRPPRRGRPRLSSARRLLQRPRRQAGRSLRWIGLAAAQYARWNRLTDQFDFLVNELYPDALKLDPAYWPAHYEAGLLFLEKYNQADAAKEFKAALELNPQAAEVHAALAALALEDHEVDAGRDVAPPGPGDQSAAAGRLAAAGRPGLDQPRADAGPAAASREGPAAESRSRGDARPRWPPAICCWTVARRGHAAPDSRFARLVDEVTRRNAHAGEFFATLAEMLEERNKQAEAERISARRSASCRGRSARRPALGLLYMRTGQEAEARRLLDEAFEADPFHVRVKNTLEVLDVLDAMQTHGTRALRAIRYDKADELLARYAARHLERVYPRTCARSSATSRRARRWSRSSTRSQGRDGHAVVQRPDDRPAVPGHRGGQHRPDRGHGLAQRAGGSASVQLGPRAEARVGPRFQLAADAVQHSALVHRGTGRVERGHAAAPALERAAANAGAAGQAVQPARRSTPASPGPWRATTARWPTARRSCTSST